VSPNILGGSLYCMRETQDVSLDSLEIIDNINMPQHMPPATVAV
jgi:hypothetical protein